jgi:hypothetical protein
MSEAPDRLRIDKWLWAARFFKTRSLASDAVDGGTGFFRGAAHRADHFGDHLNVGTVPPAPLKSEKSVLASPGPLQFTFTFVKKENAVQSELDM